MTQDDFNKDEPIVYIKDRELLYIEGLKQAGLATEWHTNLGFVKEDGDVGLYTHPPTKTAPKKPMTEEAEDEAFNSASKYAAWLETENRILREAKKPMTEREMTDAYYEADTNQYEAFVEGIRFAERHHFGIGERDE